MRRNGYDETVGGRPEPGGTLQFFVFFVFSRGMLLGHALFLLFLDGRGNERLLLVWILLGAVAIVLLLLSLPAGVSLTAHLEFLSGGPIEVCFTGLYGLVRLNFRFRLNILREPVITLYWNKRTGEMRRVWDLWHKLLPKNKTGLWSKWAIKAIWDHMAIKKFRISGHVGIRDDAFATVMLAGAVSEALSIVLHCLLGEKGKPLRVGLMPTFTKTRFRLNLEGIGRWFPIQIIVAVLMRRLRTRKGDIHGTSH